MATPRAKMPTIAIVIARWTAAAIFRVEYGWRKSPASAAISAEICGKGTHSPASGRVRDSALTVARDSNEGALEMFATAANALGMRVKSSPPFRVLARFKRAAEPQAQQCVCAAVIISQSIQRLACCRGTWLSLETFISFPLLLRDPCLPADTAWRSREYLKLERIDQFRAMGEF